MKRTTIKDIAELLQVNISTVSRALSNHPDISLAVKQKVKEAAELLNYHPNDFAINFRKKSTKVIGLIIPKLSMFFIPSIIDGISQKLRKEHYKFFILSSEESLEKEKENIQTCCNSCVDGILMSLSTETNNLDHLKLIDDLEIPLVLFDKSVDDAKYPQVLFDNKLTAENCAQKFIELKSKRILALFGNENLKITQKRKSAFLEKIQFQNSIECNCLHFDSAEQANQILEIHFKYHNYDGIFAMSDELLAGLNKALLQSPQIDAKTTTIVAISEGILPKYLNPNYLYEKNDGIKMGMRAADLLLENIQSKSNFPSIHYI